MSYPYCTCDHCLRVHAAPDMLAALKAVEAWWLETGMKEANGAPYAIFATRAAIAKATGADLAKDH